MPQKGFDLLIDAFSRISGRYPEWTMVIYGEGPEQGALEAMVRSKSLAHRIFMPGHARDPFSAFANGALFALPSRFEGFPNALCEAMACGLPVVATDCPSGPAHIIRHGVDGFLVPVDDPDALADRLSQLMANPALRKDFGIRARQGIERFSLPRVAEMWNGEIARVVG
jgi:glycosyltransferase involved in cell wall biosynthesis